MSNGLDSHQVQRFVSPGLGPNCLQMLSADDTSKHRVNKLAKKERADAFACCVPADIHIQQDLCKSATQNKHNKDLYSPVENQNDLELDFKVFFFADSCCAFIVLDESN